MRALRVGWLLGACVATFSAAPLPSRAAVPAEPPVPVLVELFTSEGCSSCPPADQLLIELVRTRFIAGAQIVALSEHVDYWNQLGWTDPFSSSQFSERQTAYGRALHDEVYTPQVIVNGRVAAVGSNRAEVLDAVRSVTDKPFASMQLSWTPELRIEVPATRLTAGADVYVAITEDGLKSTVRRGENEGRELEHVAVTRRLTRIGATSREGSFSQTVPIAPMLDPAWRRDALRVVVFLQTKGGVVGVSAVPVATHNPQLTTNR